MPTALKKADNGQWYLADENGNPIAVFAADARADVIRMIANAAAMYTLLVDVFEVLNKYRPFLSSYHALITRADKILATVKG